jgi:hypothetical protein
MKRWHLTEVGFLMAALLASPNVVAQSGRTAPDFTGVYDLVPSGTVLPGRLRNDGSPEALELLPDAAAVAKSRDLSLDTAKDCQVIGTFRMMAHEGNRIDILPWLTKIRSSRNTRVPHSRPRKTRSFGLPPMPYSPALHVASRRPSLWAAAGQCFGTTLHIGVKTVGGVSIQRKYPTCFNRGRHISRAPEMSRCLTR